MSVVNGQENGQQQKPTAPSAAQPEQKPNQPLSVIVVGPVSLEREKTVEPDWAKPDCQKPGNHDEADLCQQVSMSEAAQKAVTLNYVQVGLGFVTLIGLAFTVKYARDAAKAASAAVDEAHKGTLVALKSAEEANKANELAKSSHVTDVRPWVTVEISLATPIFLQNNGRVQFPIAVKAKNIGRTPAESLHLSVYSKRYSEPGNTLASFVQEHTKEGAQFRSTILLPGETHTQVWPQVPMYDAPDERAGGKVTLFSFYVGAFYKTSMINGDRITATSYIAAISVGPSEGGHVLQENVVGFNRDEGLVT